MAVRAGKRQNLRERILEAAEARIGAGGVSSLRARDVMADAGAAVGGLYNAFADLDDVVLHINSRTLARLHDRLSNALSGAPEPAAALTALSLAYLAFARDHPNLWSALFDHRFGAGHRVPDWHLAEQSELLTLIVGPLRDLRPDWSDAILRLRARTMFGAIHGIVSVSLENRFVGLSGDDLTIEIAGFVEMIVAGIGHGRAGPQAED